MSSQSSYYLKKSNTSFLNDYRPATLTCNYENLCVCAVCKRLPNVISLNAYQQTSRISRAAEYALCLHLFSSPEHLQAYHLQCIIFVDHISVFSIGYDTTLVDQHQSVKSLWSNFREMQKALSLLIVVESGRVVTLDFLRPKIPHSLKWDDRDDWLCLLICVSVLALYEQHESRKCFSVPGETRALGERSSSGQFHTQVWTQDTLTPLCDAVVICCAHLLVYFELGKGLYFMPNDHLSCCPPDAPLTRQAAELFFSHTHSAALPDTGSLSHQIH